MPATPTIVVSNQDANGRISVVVTNSDSPDSNRVYRSTPSEYGGIAQMVAVGIAVDGTFLDSNVAAGVPYTYHVEAVASGVVAASATATTTLTLSRLWLHAIDKLSATANVYGSALDLHNLSPEEWNQSRLTGEYVMSGRATSLLQTSRLVEGQFSVNIRIPQSDVADRETLLEMMEADRYVCVRNPNGQKFFGVLTEIDLQDYGFYTDFRLSLIEVDFRETQEWTRTSTQSSAINGFTVEEIDKALAAFYLPRKNRTRVELLDKRNNVLNPNFKHLILTSSSAKYIADTEIQGTARLSILERSVSLDAYPDLVNDDAPLFFWRLSETSGTVANDATGNGRTGTYAGGFTLAQPSLLAGATDSPSVKFNGSSATISIADNAAWDSAVITLEAWIQTSATAGRILSRDAAWNLIVNGSGFLAGRVTISTAETTFTTNAKVNDGLPHHVVMTFDGSFARLFVDSVQVLKTAHTGSIDSATTAIYVGSQAAAAGFFNGWIDEVAVYARALTAAEIRHHYQKGAASLIEVNYTQDRFRINSGVRMHENGDDGTPWAEWPIITCMLVGKPARRSTETGIIVDVDAYDKCRFLADAKVSDRYVVAASTNVVTAITTALAAAGLESTEYSITASSLTTPAAREWASGTSYLQIVNDLLYSINYLPLHFTGAGVGIGEPYILPAERAVQWTYEDDDDSLIAGDVEEADDLVETPNEIRLIDVTPGIPPIDTTSQNNEWDNSGSIAKRGQTVTETEEVSAVNQTILDALADRELTERTAANQATFYTPSTPFHEHRDILHVEFVNDDFQLGVNGNFIEIERDCPLDEVTDRCRHRVRAVVDIV